MTTERIGREFVDRRGDRDVQSVGPFERYPTMVNGWTVPYLEASYRDDGSVTLSLDQRLAIDVPADLAGQVIEFVADAIAIAAGWSCHPTASNWTPENDVPPLRSVPWHQMHGITDKLESHPPRGAAVRRSFDAFAGEWYYHDNNGEEVTE